MNHPGPTTPEPPPFVPSEVEGGLPSEAEALGLAGSRLRSNPAPRLRSGRTVGGGKLTPDAPLAPLVWFKAGGSAEWLFEPKDVADLQEFLRDLPADVPVMALGLGSNLIVRDGGVPGVVVRLGKAFAQVSRLDAVTLECGGGASGILVSSTARDAGIAGLEFLRSIPGTVGGFVRMNGGAYGREVKDVLVTCDVVLRSGDLVTLPVADLHYTYRHSELPEGAIVVSARFRGEAGDPAAIQAEMDRISASREASQPLRSKTGGSTFKNPEGHKAWELVDKHGRRAGQRETHQLPDQHRRGDQRRDRGAGRGSAAKGQGAVGRGARVGNSKGRAEMMACPHPFASSEVERRRRPGVSTSLDTIGDS